MSHFRNECKHGTVISQCRCPGPKVANVIDPCPFAEHSMTVTDRTAATDEEFRARFDRFGIFDEERIVDEVARAIQARLAYHRVVVRDSEASEAAVAAVTAYRATDGGAEEAVRRARWIDSPMRDPWHRDLIAGTTAEHAADLHGWAERIAYQYGKSGTLEITAVIWALLDALDDAQAATDGTP